MNRDRFHGRVPGTGQPCASDGCTEPGEFRAPDPYGAPSGFDGPGAYRWLCFDHVREFNSSYNFFNGMSRAEIEEAQMPFAGWERESRAFTQGGVDAPPKWRDFHDPLDAISARFRAGVAERASRLPAEDQRALKVMGLDEKADRKAIRARYTQLLRQYHPDHNGGDRTHETKLQAVVDAYQRLRASPAFATER